MHVTTKEVVTDEKQAKDIGVDVGTHIVTTVVEADGASELASKDAKFECDVISVRRTDSGGVEFQVALAVREPLPVKEEVKEEVKQPTPREKAVEYFVSKGFKKEEAEKQVDKFGEARVLAMRESELDQQLAETLAPKQ